MRRWVQGKGVAQWTGESVNTGFCQTRVVPSVALQKRLDSGGKQKGMRRNGQHSRGRHTGSRVNLEYRVLCEGVCRGRERHRAKNRCRRHGSSIGVQRHVIYCRNCQMVGNRRISIAAGIGRGKGKGCNWPNSHLINGNPDGTLLTK